VIHAVDESLRKLVLQDAVNGSGVEISFEAPTKEWSARRNAPTVSIYLYDVREDLERRDVEFERVRGEDGRVVQYRPPPRRFKLSYLVTVWTQRPEDEHRLLSTLLACFLAHETLPSEVMPAELGEVPYATFLTVALPPPKDRSLADVWSALGGELKPSLDLVLTAPFDTARVLEAGPPVLEEPRITVTRPGDGAAPEGGRGRGRRAKPVVAEPAPAADETVAPGKGGQGRVVRVRDVRGR
jgi:Pvc16 N-terminal domain